MQHSDPIVAIAPGRVRGLWRAGSAAFLGIPHHECEIAPQVVDALRAPPGEGEAHQLSVVQGLCAFRS